MSKIVIKQTTYNVWWKNEGEDFPNLNIIKELNESFVVSEYKLNFINQFQAQVKIKSSDLNISAFKIESDDNFDNQIYVVKSIDKKISDGILILSLVVDQFSSYGYKILELNNKFLTKRTHRFNKLSFQMEDGLLNSLPIYYDKNNILKKNYENEYGETPILVKSNKYGTYNSIFNSTINGVVYYVFGRALEDAKNTTKYTLIPLLGNGSINTPLEKETQLETWYITDENEIWEEILLNIKSYQEKYSTIRMTVEDMTSPNVSNLPKIESYNYRKPENKIEVKTPSYNKYQEVWLHGSMYLNRSYTKSTMEVVIENQPYSKTTEKMNENRSPVQGQFPPYPPEDWLTIKDKTIKISIYGNLIGNGVFIKNSLDNIENELITSPELVNKFQGIFFLPNISNFTIKQPNEITGIFKDYIAVEIGTEGIDIPSFSITDKIFLDKNQAYKLLWNNENIESVLFLKFLDISYYSNIKNWNFYYNGTEISLGGKFIFNGVGSLITNTGIDKTFNNIIEFPYQLPSAVDQYTKYYSGIMSGINTGMEAQKKNYEINKNQQVLNTFMNSVSQAPSFAANIASGNVGGVVSGGLSLAGGIGNALLDRQSLNTGNEMYYKQLGSQFQDVQRTQTTSFNNSSIQDLSFIFSNTGTINSESIQMKNLTKDTIININNMLYLYGYQNIGWYDWSELLLYSNFNYVELEHNEITRIILNDLDFKVRNIYEVVINFWNKGRRLWNVKPNRNENLLKIKEKDNEKK